jgi:hypothetical protein
MSQVLLYSIFNLHQPVVSVSRTRLHGNELEVKWPCSDNITTLGTGLLQVLLEKRETNYSTP